MHGIASISFRRYCDMLAASVAARTTSVTRPAYRLRWTAACPPSSAADHVHLTTREPLPLGRRRAVEHADAVEVLEVGDVETAVVDTHGEDHAAGADLAAVGDREHVIATIGLQAGHVAHQQEGGPEHPGLLVRRTGRARRRSRPVRSRDSCGSESSTPPGPRSTRASTTKARNPSDEAYTAAASPAGPAPTMTTSNSRPPSSSVITPSPRATPRSTDLRTCGRRASRRRASSFLLAPPSRSTASPSGELFG